MSSTPGLRADKKSLYLAAAVVCVICMTGCSKQPPAGPDVGKTGGPVEGISVADYAKFHEGKKLFEHDFHIEDGLGPLFNRKSCASCHGRPDTTGGDGRPVDNTTVTRVAKRKQSFAKEWPLVSEVIENATAADIDTLNSEGGGPVLASRSVVIEYPKQFPPGSKLLPNTMPPDAELFSLRHAPALFGAGLVEAVPDAVFKELEKQQKKRNNNVPFGKVVTVINPIDGVERVGRFGHKAQHPTVFSFAAEAMHVEQGLTTPLHPLPKTDTGLGHVPTKIAKVLPPDPNDNGEILTKLAFFVSMLAPPERGEINDSVRLGEETFFKLGCAVCHVPTLQTGLSTTVPSFGATIKSVDFADSEDQPDTEKQVIAVHGLKASRIAALENKHIHPYSDYLVHDMGKALADGIGQNNARGGEWRTAPLWGLRHRKAFLHDGRARTLEAAISAHGGQALPSVDAFRELDPATKADLMAFLQSL